VEVTMEAMGMLESLLRHSVMSALPSQNGDEQTATPILNITLATHDCEGLHKEYSPLAFTFSQLAIRVSEDHMEKAPKQLRLEIARAGRSVQTPMRDIGGESGWDCAWEESDALRVAVHMFFADSYQQDGTYMQKNILLRLKDATTGATFAAARLDLSTYFTAHVQSRLLELDLFAIDDDDDAIGASRWLKSGFWEVASLFGVGDPAATLTTHAYKEIRSTSMVGVLETPHSEGHNHSSCS